MSSPIRRTCAGFVVCLATIVSVATMAHAQDRAAQPVVDRLVSLACDKRIVLLGELPSHGEAMAFDLKARVVDRLIAHCGFTAVLFEAPIYDFLGLARAAGAGTAMPLQLDNAIGRFWWTRELAPWRRSLFEAVTAGRLVVGGLDDQVSITSQYARATLPALIAGTSPDGRASECRASVERHLGWTYDAATPFDDAEKQRLHECARDAAAGAATRGSADASDRVMLDSFARYVERQREGATTGRDASMARNLAWHVDRLPANSRVVVWTATVHASKYRGALADDPLGAQVAGRLGHQMLAVGFTARQGSSSMAGRPPRPIDAAPADSLEAMATREAAVAVLDSRQLRGLGRIPSRLLGRFAAEGWADYFDAVVVIGEESAPTFEPWK